MDDRQPESETLVSRSASGSNLQVGQQEILGAIERIRSSQTFIHSRRLLELLDFIVAATFRGGGRSLDENAIGVALYHRDENYDTTLEVIVHTQAKRLRERLSEYYAGDGVEETVVIKIPEGSYGLVIERRPSSDPTGA